MHNFIKMFQRSKPIRTFINNLKSLDIFIDDESDATKLMNYLNMYIRKCYSICTSYTKAHWFMDLREANKELEYMIENVEKITGQRVKYNGDKKMYFDSLPLSNADVRKILDPENKCTCFNHDRMSTKRKHILINYSLRTDCMFTFFKGFARTDDDLLPAANGFCIFFDNNYFITTDDLIAQNCYEIWEFYYENVGLEIREVLVSQLFIEKEYDFFFRIQGALVRSANFRPSLTRTPPIENSAVKFKEVFNWFGARLFHAETANDLIDFVAWPELYDLYHSNFYISELLRLLYVRIGSIGSQTVEEFHRNHTHIESLQQSAIDVYALKTLIIHQSKSRTMYDLFVCNRSMDFFSTVYFDADYPETVRKSIEEKVPNPFIKKLLFYQLAKIEYLADIGHGMSQSLPYLAVKCIVGKLTDLDIHISMVMDPNVNLDDFFKLVPTEVLNYFSYV